MTIKFRTIEFRHFFVKFDKFSVYTWCVPLNKENVQFIADGFSKFLTTSKRKPNETGNDRGPEFYNSIFQNFLELNNVHQYSRFVDEGLSIAEKVIRKIRILIKKPKFERGHSDWMSEVPSVTKI